MKKTLLLIIGIVFLAAFIFLLVFYINSKKQAGFIRTTKEQRNVIEQMLRTTCRRSHIQQLPRRPFDYQESFFKGNDKIYIYCSFYCAESKTIKLSSGDNFEKNDFYEQLIIENASGIRTEMQIHIDSLFKGMSTSSTDFTIYDSRPNIEFDESNKVLHFTFDLLNIVKNDTMKIKLSRKMDGSFSTETIETDE